MATQAAQAGGINGVLLDYKMPLGLSGAHTLDIAEAQVVDTDVVWVPPAAGTITTDGFFKFNAANQYFKTSALPAKTTATRMYRMSCRYVGASPPTNVTAAVKFNVTGGNYFQGKLQFTSGSFKPTFVEVNPTFSFRRVGIGVNPATPRKYMITIYDNGDSIYMFTHGFQGGGTTGFAEAISYWIASRPLKTEVGCELGNATVTGFEFSRFTVADIGLPP